MIIEPSSLDNWLVLHIKEDRLDAAVAEDLKNNLEEYLGMGHQNLMLDLSDVEFMDSSGLGALVYTLQRMSEEGRIAISNARDPVALMLRLTHMDKIFTLVESPEDIRQESI